MSTSDMIYDLCAEVGISLSELARRLGQTPQNFNKKLKRETISTKELIEIANVLGIRFEQSFSFYSGKKIYISNRNA
ncbi:MAG: helix-turn-helix domain-containing protein [Ruminococcus sp.]